MKGARPVFKKLLIAAIAIFVVGVCVAVSELYYKVGAIEHKLMHITSGSVHH